MTSFLLPDLGEGLREAEITAWHVAPGDHVVTGQPLVSVETDKAVVEIPSPHSGHIESLHGDAGDLIEVGDVLVEFSGEERTDTGTVVGEIPPVEAEAPARKAAPAVRVLAGRLGVDLAPVRGTGPEGAITSADVTAAAEAAGRSVSRGEPLRGFRRAMARRMTQAHSQAVPASVTEEADIEAWPVDTDPMVRLVRAIVAACKAEPALNCWYESSPVARVLHDHVDLGIAVDTAEGLIVPTLRDAESLSPEQVWERLRELSEAAQARSLLPESLTGQTITLSNFGAIGGRHAAMVIVPPQVAIVGAGRIEPRAVARDGQLAVRRILPLSLTFDHRAVTGGEAARFIAALAADLESEEAERGGT